MEYFDANLVYNTIYDRHLLLTDNFPHTMIKTIDDALKSKAPRELDKLEAWIDSSLDFNKFTDDELVSIGKTAQEYIKEYKDSKLSINKLKQLVIKYINSIASTQNIIEVIKNESRSILRSKRFKS